MRYTKEKLYELLSAIYRQRDIENGRPLEALLGIIAEQVEVLENDITCLYENLFIETCEPWVVPYIGDLVAARILHHIENTTVSQRAWVANTIAYRRRKGTAAMLEQLARDVTGWNARVVEFFEILNTTQYLNHLRPQNVGVNIRDQEKIELLNTPFDTIPHTIDVRSIRSGNGSSSTRRIRGYYNIPNIGIFLWRLQAYEASDVPAFNHGEGRFTFSQLGYDMPLFNTPVTETRITHIAEEINVPGPIRRLALLKHLEDYYYSSQGIGRSIKIKADGMTISSNKIIVCDLGTINQDWAHRPPSGKVAIDPELGRIAFPTDEIPDDVHVTYYYGFSSDMGSGFYKRPEKDDNNNKNNRLALIKEDTKTYKISKRNLENQAFLSIEDAITQWQIDGKPEAIFKILDSEFYEMPNELLLPESRTTIIILSEQKQRPVLRIRGGGGGEGVDEEVDGSILNVTGGAGDVRSRLVFDGLLMDLRLKIKEKLRHLEIRHCTLVPKKDASSIEYEGNFSLHVSLDHTICGRIDLKGSEDESGLKPETELKIADSIVDGEAINANDNDNGGGDAVVVNGQKAIECFKAIIENSTIFGEVDVSMLELASNTIFTEKVTVERRQHGCVRFSYMPDGSKVPRRYRCQPAHRTDEDPSMIAESSLMIYPRFTSERYGEPGYAQLHKDVAPEIFKGGDNGAEMGAFNQLYQPQRISNLESSLDEYLRFGLEAGILLVDGKMRWL